MFADDAKCFRRIVDIDDCMYLQIGEPLEKVSSFCDLGITVDSFLTHNVHIKNAIIKCNKVNGMIRRAVGYKAPASVTLKLYKALIRPIGEYSSPVWSPFYKSHIELIGRIQRHFTRYAMHYPPLNYKNRCVDMNILPLSFRRRMAYNKLFFKSMFTTNFSNNISELVKTYIPKLRLRSNQKGLILESKQRHIRGIILIELLLYGTSYHQNCVWILLLIFLLRS